MAQRRRRFGDRQRQAVGHAQLLDHQVDAGSLLGHGVLDLQARVDLQERDRAAGAEQEFDGAGAGVASGSADIARGGMDAGALFVAQERRRGLFHQLLVAPLQRAVARAEHYHVAMLVGEHLGFDMARLVEELFDKAFATAKGGDRLAHGRRVQLFDLIHAPGDLHAAATAAERRLDDDRQAVALGKGQHFVGIVHRIGRAGHQRRAHLQRDLACFHLVAQPGDRFRRRADPGQAGIDHRAGKGFAFRQEAIAGMHGIGAAAARDLEQLGDIQVGVRRAVAVEAVGFVGQARVDCVDIGIGIDGNGGHAIVGAGADDANGDLATVGNQDFLHGSYGCSSSKAPTGLKRSQAPTGICPARSR
ncbi:hypothetical protein D3C72_1061510 [compost metagenome]